MKKYLIFTPQYDENNGGAICLHYLAHLINKQGGDAYLFRMFENSEINQYNFVRPFLKALRRKLFHRFRKFNLNETFDNKIIDDLSVVDGNDEWIVVYPEITFGNPLRGKNVVRWLLHNPGFHTGKVYYGSNELYFKYHQGFSDFNFPGSVASSNILYLSYYPLHLYNMDGVSSARSGTAYCLRKGCGRNIEHDLTDSVLIDGMSHEEIAAIFKRVKAFISYDPYTAYSVFAVLCGCDSVVLPVPNLTKEEWHPNSERVYGISYGFDGVIEAASTRKLLLETVLHDHKENAAQVAAFIEETQTFFGNQGDIKEQ